jgi:hypothetical protein
LGFKKTRFWGFKKTRQNGFAEKANMGFGAAQVNVFLWWADALKNRVPCGKTALFVNLDETAVGYAFPRLRGNVVGKALLRGECLPRDGLRRSDIRGTITHAAMITHRTDIQPCLPQVFIGDSRRFTKTFLAAASDVKPANVHFLKEKTAWNNAAVMVRILHLLSEALQKWPSVQPILVLDTAKCHLCTKVLRCAADLGIWVMVVPAKLTWALQPLDTHAFSMYKHYLRTRFRECRSQHGCFTSQHWLGMLCDVVVQVLNGRKWQRAFESTGLLGNRSALGPDLQRLGFAGFASADPLLPSGEALAKVFPRRFKVPYWELTRGPAGRRRRLVLVYGSKKAKWH